MEPPKIGDGVFGFNFGAVHAFGAAGAAFAPSASARIAVDRRAVVDRRVRVAFATVARGVSAELEMANIVVCRVREVRGRMRRARACAAPASAARDRSRYARRARYAAVASYGAQCEMGFVDITARVVWCAVRDGFSYHCSRRMVRSARRVLLISPVWCAVRDGFC